MTPSSEMQIPFVDLKAQYSSIKEEIDGAVHAVLDSARYVSGEWVEKFENEFARYVGAKYAIGVGSGTAALELALKAAHIGPGDEVIVPANSFIATAEAVSNIGAKARFADVDPTTFHLDAASVEQALTPKTRAVIPVHLYGRAMDLTGIENLAARHHLEVIEDAAQAHGAERSGTKVGGSGRLTCFSFYPTKNLGAYGDAGAITTNDARHAENLRLLRDHGSRVKHQHLIVGTNSRLDSIQAAVLSVKLRYLEKWNSARRNHASVYAAALKNSAICPPQVPRDGEHIFHLFVIRTPRRDDLKKYLASRGIGTDIHYPLPLHLTDAYKNFAYSQKGRLSVSERLAAEVLSLPMYPELSEAQIEYVARALLQFAGGAYA